MGNRVGTVAAVLGFVSCAAACGRGAADDANGFEPAEKIGTADSALMRAAPTLGQPIGSGAVDWSLGDVGVDANGNATVIYRRKLSGVTNVVVNQWTHGAGWSAQAPLDGAGNPKPATVNGNERGVLAVGASGTADAVWVSGFDANYTFSVQTAHYDPASGWTPMQPLASGLQGPEVHGIAATADGALAIWDDFDADSFVRPRVSRLADASGWAGPQKLADHTSYAQAIAANASGAAVAVWVDKVPFESLYRIMAKQFRPDAGWDADATSIAGGDPSAQPWDVPSVAIDDAGNETMVALQNGQIVASHLDAAAGWGAITMLGASAGDRLHGPSLCSNGRFTYVAWPSADGKLALSAFDPASGWTTSAPPSLTTNDADVQSVPVVQCAVDATGRLTLAYVVWTKDATLPGGLSAHLWAQARVGGAWIAPAQIGPSDDGFDDNPAIRVGPSGDVCIAWEHSSAADGVTIWAARHAASH